MGQQLFRMSMSYKLIIGLFRKVMDYLSEGAYDQIDDMLSHPELGDQFRGVLREYVTLITIKNQQIDSHMNDFIFFKSVIKKINKGDVVTIEDVMDQHNVNHEKLEVAAGLISRIEEIKEESKIFAGSNILVGEEKMGGKDLERLNELQMENIKMHSLLNILQEEAREEKQELMRKIEALGVESEKREEGVRSLESKLAILCGEIERLNEQAAPKLNAIALLEGQIQRLQRDNKEKANEIEMTNANVQQLVLQIQQLSKSLIEKDQSLQTAFSKADELRQLLDQKQKYIETIIAQSERHQQRLYEQEESLGKAREQMKSYKSKNESASQILVEKQEIIKQQDLNISNLRQEIEGNAKQRSKAKGWSNISEILISDQHNILLFFAKFINANQFLAEGLFRSIQTHIGNIQKVQLLYKYSSHKHLKFHNLIDRKPGLLLMCLTEDDRLIGGFSTAALSLDSEPKDTRAFLFTSSDNEIKQFQLKPKKRSLEYDMDYIIFGNEQLCIQRNTLELTSFAVVGSTSRLNYQIDVGQRATFLLDDHSKNKIRNKVVLKDYQVVQVFF